MRVTTVNNGAILNRELEIWNGYSIHGQSQQAGQETKIVSHPIYGTNAERNAPSPNGIGNQVPGATAY